MKCFADNGKKCTALIDKKCEGCKFFKTQEKKSKDEEKAIARLDSMKHNAINILF